MCVTNFSLPWKPGIYRRGQKVSPYWSVGAHFRGLLFGPYSNSLEREVSASKISYLFKLTIILVLLLVRLPPLPWRSQIAVFSMPCLISEIKFYFHFVNQFHLFMLISTHPSLLHFLHSSPLHSFTLNSKLTFWVNPFRNRSLTIDTSDWLPRLIGPVHIGLSSWFCVR